MAILYCSSAVIVSGSADIPRSISIVRMGWAALSMSLFHPLLHFAHTRWHCSSIFPNCRVVVTLPSFVNVFVYRPRRGGTCVLNSPTIQLGQTCSLVSVVVGQKRQCD